MKERFNVEIVGLEVENRMQMSELMSLKASRAVCGEFMHIFQPSSLTERSVAERVGVLSHELTRPPPCLVPLFDPDMAAEVVGIILPALPEGGDHDSETRIVAAQKQKSIVSLRLHLWTNTLSPSPVRLSFLPSLSLSSHRN